MFSLYIIVLCGLAAAVATTQLEVSFPSSDGLMLEGTLYLPDTKTAATSTTTTKQHQVPGVVLIHGSGLQSRDVVINAQLNVAFGFEIPIFAQIAQALSNQGIAVLTYDKRTCGSFNGCYNNSYPEPDYDAITVHDFMEDALAAASFLWGHDRIGQVVIVGHSQSGPFIPIMLQQRPESIRSGVMLMTPFVPFDELMQFQLDSTLALLQKSFGLNQTEALALPNVQALADYVQWLRDIRNGSSNDTTTTFYTSLYQLQDVAIAAAAHVQQPLLIVGGENDWNVPASEAQAWDEYLSTTTTTVNYEVIVLPCITHALNCMSETDPAKFDAERHVGRQVDSFVTQALYDFVMNTTAVEQEEPGDDGSGAMSVVPSAVSIWASAAVVAGMLSRL